MDALNWLGPIRPQYELEIREEIIQIIKMIEKEKDHSIKTLISLTKICKNLILNSKRRKIY